MAINADKNNNTQSANSTPERERDPNRNLGFETPNQRTPKQEYNTHTPLWR